MMKQLQLKHWQGPAVALLGAWFAVSPWVLGLQGPSMLRAASVVLGAVLLALGVDATRLSHAGVQGGMVTAGAVTAASPWLLGAAGESAFVWNAVLVGLATLGPALWALAREHRLDGWRPDRMAH